MILVLIQQIYLFQMGLNLQSIILLSKYLFDKPWHFVSTT